MNALHRIREALADHRLRPLVIAGAATVVAVVGVAAFGILHEQRTPATLTEPPGFALSPAGDDVARLAPIRVTYEFPPAERDGSQLLKLEPQVKGEYAWLSDRTLLFQPEYPGLLRGQAYEVSVAARPEAGLPQEFRRTFTVTGKLLVQNVIPAPEDVDVPANGQVLIQFSRSVAPLTTLSEADLRQPVVFDPPLEGTGAWLNTSLYRFVPSAMAPNTRYTATVKAGLTSAADGKLEADYTWTFTSYGPALDSVNPDAGALYAAPRQPVTLKFNQKMDQAGVESAFALTSGTGRKVPGSFAWSDGGRTATFTPAADLERGLTYTVNVPAGLKGASGGTTKVAWTSSFTTVKVAGIERTSPSDGSTGASRYGATITFNNPMNTDSLEGKVSVSGVDPSTVFQYWYEDDRIMNINTPLRPSTRYTVTIAAGATDRYGQPMPAASFSFTTGALEPRISFAIPGIYTTYSAGAEPLLYYHAINMASATFTFYRLTPDEAATVRSINAVPKDRQTQWTPSTAPMRTWTETNPAPSDEVLVLSTSLAPGTTLPKGDYYVKSTGGDYFAEMAFTVVDTVIVTKLSNDQMLAWVLDHDTGRPLSGVTVTASGNATGDQVTDANGLATWPVARANGTWPPRNTQYVLNIESGGHRGVTLSAWQQGAQPYQLGIPTEYYARNYVGLLYTERPIYRPGEEVQFKGVVRLDDDAAYSVPGAVSDLRLTINSADGKSLLDQLVSLNDFGTFAGSFTLPSDAAIGNYGIGLTWWPASASQYGSVGVTGTSFLVAEFRVPEFEVAVSTGKPSYANGDSIDAKATAAFFFGGALTGAKTEWSVLASPQYVRMKGYETYTFGETQRWRYGPESVIRDPVRATGTALTGADGVAAFNVPAVLKGEEGAQQFTISATVTDQSAQAVANATTVTVHPASLYAGVKTDTYIGTAGQASKAEVVTLTTDGVVVPNKAVRVLVYDRKWVTTKESTPDGARRYRSDPVDTLLETLTVTTDAKGLGSVNFTPKTAGTIRLVGEVTDDRGRTARSATYLWVSGAGQASWRISNDDIIQLVADKEKYEVGDTAQVLVPAPFEGAKGLVTIERGKIISKEVRDFPATSTTLSIPITAKSVPNVFVSTVLYRPPTTADPIPRYKVGYVELPVSTSTRALNVDIKADRDQAKPGDTVRYTIRVTDSAGKGVKAELSAAVVDKAVLSLAEDRSQTGLAAFWFERGLGVTTSSSLAVSVNRSNDVIAEPRQGGKGGGGLEDERLRQEFKNTAYWSPQLVTKDDGTLTVDVKMPDNLTTWRFQARAVSGDTLVGEGTNELVSTQPLLLRPALPRFLRVGDNATLRLLVRNATKESSDVTVTLQAEGVDVKGDLSRKTKVAAGQSAVLEWPAAVVAEGTAKLTFSAKGSGGLSDAVVQEIPIALDVTPETTATGGVVGTESMTEAIYLPAYALLKGGTLDVSVQGTLVGSLASELEAFKPYPVRWYEPSERIAGRIVATIGIARSEKAQGVDASGRLATVANDVAKLLSRQRQDGGWSWCESASCVSVPQVTASVLLALGEANREGVTVSDAQIGRASSYVGGYITRSVDVANPADASEKAYMLYAIAAGSGSGQTYLSTMRALQNGYRAKLANWGRAYLLMAYEEAGLTKGDQQVNQLLNDLAGGVLPSANGNHWEDPGAKGSYMTTTRATALALNALVRVDPSHPLIEETVRWLMNARSTGGWETDVERAQAILALSEFAAGTGELRGDFTYHALLGAREILSGQVKRGAAPVATTKQVPLTEVGAGKVTLFELARQATQYGRLYYTLTLRYMTPAKGVEAVNRGFAISHEYSLLDGDGKPVTKVKLGDTVRVKVTVLLPEDHTYVVAEDFLPAGLEPIDPQLKTTDPKLVAQLNSDRAATRPKELSYWAPWFGWYYNPWQQVDTRDDRVTLRATRLEKGVYEYIYYARATAPGDYFIAPAHIQDSYFKDVFGRSDSGRFVIEP